jgi:transcription-repair coupling factor (superfamily II helicase)
MGNNGTKPQTSFDGVAVCVERVEIITRGGIVRVWTLEQHQALRIDILTNSMFCIVSTKGVVDALNMADCQAITFKPRIKTIMDDGLPSSIQLLQKAGE